MQRTTIMTIRHLKIFVEVAESGTMSAAAERCFISQPTVSQVIRELEEHYQVRLFERLSKKLYITDAGERLLTSARKVLEQFNLLETNMESSRAEEYLRIGATITVGACLLSSILNDMKQLHPKLNTYAYVANTSTIQEKLLHSELDVALVEGVISHPDLICIPVVDDFLVLAVANGHPLAREEQIRVEELAQYDFVMREKGSGTRKLFEDYLKEHGVPCRIAWEATCPDTIKSAILYNNCIAAVSVRLLEREVASGQVHIIRSMESDWNRSFFLVYHKDKYFSDAMHSLEGITHRYKCPELPENLKIGSLTCA